MGWVERTTVGTFATLTRPPPVFATQPKKSPQLEPVNHKLLKTIDSERVEVEIRLVEETEEGIEESELDEMWSYVSRKSNQRWLWHAIDRLTGQVLAYTFGQRKDESFSSSKTC